MATDVDFDNDVRPYICLDDVFYLCIPNDDSEIQIREIRRMGITVAERVSKLKECLQVSVSEARNYFSLPEIFPGEDGKFIETIQHYLLFKKLLKPEEIVWMFSGTMLVPMWRVHYMQYWKEKQKEGFVDEFFFRGCVFAVSYFLEKFPLPTYPDSVELRELHPWRHWFNPTVLSSKERELYKNAVGNRWGVAKELMLINDTNKSVWKPVRRLFRFDAPADFSADDVHNWKCVFNEIIAGKLNRESYLGKWIDTIQSFHTSFVSPLLYSIEGRP